MNYSRDWPVGQASLTTAEEVKAEGEMCGACNGTGFVPRDPDIGTDQECFVCDGSGKVNEDVPRT